MKLVWLSDLHTNFWPTKLPEFAKQIAEQEPDAVLISGDIADANSLLTTLSTLYSLPVPVYFVCGNHDFYHGSIQHVRMLLRNHENYLTHPGIITLTETTALIGHDGWADARNGDYEHSNLVLNDWYLIRELCGWTKSERRIAMQSLAAEAAVHINKWLPKALEYSEHVIVLTHVPPFAAAALYAGQRDSAGLPFFSSKCVGDILLQHAKAFPDKQITVLCGHTHSGAVHKPLPNLEVRVAAAEYYAPAIAGILNIA